MIHTALKWRALFSLVAGPTDQRCVSKCAFIGSNALVPEIIYRTAQVRSLKRQVAICFAYSEQIVEHESR